MSDVFANTMVSSTAALAHSESLDATSTTASPAGTPGKNGHGSAARSVASTRASSPGGSSSTSSEEVVSPCRQSFASIPAPPQESGMSALARKRGIRAGFELDTDAAESFSAGGAHAFPQESMRTPLGSPPASMVPLGTAPAAWPQTPMGDASRRSPVQTPTPVLRQTGALGDASQRSPVGASQRTPVGGCVRPCFSTTPMPAARADASQRSPAGGLTPPQRSVAGHWMGSPAQGASSQYPAVGAAWGAAAASVAATRAAACLAAMSCHQNAPAAQSPNPPQKTVVVQTDAMKRWLAGSDSVSEASGQGLAEMLRAAAPEVYED